MALTYINQTYEAFGYIPDTRRKSGAKGFYYPPEARIFGVKVTQGLAFFI